MSDILNDVGLAILAQEHGLPDLANQYWAQVLARLDGMPLTVKIPLDDKRTLEVTIEANKRKPTNAPEVG